MPAASEFPARIGPADGGPSAAEQLATVLRRYRKAMSAALTAEDYSPIMPAAAWLLLAMAREPGTVGQLAGRLGLAKQAVSRLADRLVTLGYCDRRRSETNRRQVLLRATDEGARAAAVLRAGIEQADALLLGDLSEGERATFLRTLAAVAERASQGQERDGPGRQTSRRLRAGPQSRGPAALPEVDDGWGASHPPAQPEQAVLVA